MILNCLFIVAILHIYK